MKQLTINFPESLQMTEKEINDFLAAKLYESKKVSLSDAAGIAGVSETEFVEILGHYDVEVVKEPLPKRTRDAGQF